MFKYHITKRNKINGMVVEFTGLSEGKIIKNTEFSKEVGYYVGDKLYNFIAHTNTEIWEDINILEEVKIWKDVKELEPVYYYQWEKLHPSGMVSISEWVTDEYAKSKKYKERGWRKIKSIKGTLEKNTDG